MDFRILFFIFIRCRFVYLENGIVQKHKPKKGDGIQKFTYRCDMGACAHIVPQLFIMMTSTISNYSGIFSLSSYFYIYTYNIKHFSGRKWSTFLVLYLIKIAFFFFFFFPFSLRLCLLVYIIYVCVCVCQSNNHYCLLLIRWDAIIIMLPSSIGSLSKFPFIGKIHRREKKRYQPSQLSNPIFRYSKHMIHIGKKLNRKC